ncbi:7-deoxyloganetin glucosyltransferase-like [Silene latifolia]|uniref:7-deoxyloganetin glucosyltransferase-like n=1 Tax=Silene latifolia TaxID=37657 RepID=UPI003D77E228
MTVNGKEPMVHAVCVPFAAQGHITPMLQLAKFLNSKGIYITFVNTQHNHHCMLSSNGPDSLKGTSSFRFETFPDGLPPSNANGFRDVFPLLLSLRVNCPQPFMELLYRINDPSTGSPPITLIISDIHMPFARDVARMFGDCPLVLFYPPSPCSFLAYAHLDNLLDKDILPFKGPDFMSDGSLNKKPENLAPSMKGIQLKDFPSFIRSTDKDHPLFKYMRDLVERAYGVPLIFNTFKALDQEILNDISNLLVSSPIYTIGPLHCLANNLAQDNTELGSLGCNLWKEDIKTLEWLDSKEPNSVLYVSFGTTLFMTNEQLIEFSWGLANSKYPFLWIIRPDMVIGGGSSIIPPEFLDEVKDRGMLSSWCAQEKVLNHPSVKVYLSHSGWNSTLESISSGVPLICWPSYADQPINCWYSCEKLGVGLEMEGITRRDVEEIITEAMDSKKGKEIKKRTMEWKSLVKEAISLRGSSTLECDRFMNYLLSLKDQNNISN